jgi:hypothetical protein
MGNELLETNAATIFVANSMVVEASVSGFFAGIPRVFTHKMGTSHRLDDFVLHNIRPEKQSTH